MTPEELERYNRLHLPGFYPEAVKAPPRKPAEARMLNLGSPALTVAHLAQNCDFCRKVIVYRQELKGKTVPCPHCWRLVFLK